MVRAVGNRSISLDYQFQMVSPETYLTSSKVLLWPVNLRLKGGCEGDNSDMQKKAKNTEITGPDTEDVCITQRELYVSTYKETNAM